MYYKNEHIEARPKIPVSNPKDEQYKNFGWVPLQRDIPEFDPETQRIEQGEIIETETEATQTYNVIDLTPEEIEKRKYHSLSELDKVKSRISEATDFTDLKTKLTKIKDSENTPTKWADKLKLHQDEIINHKEVLYLVLKDHIASKEAEPQNTPELYIEQ